MVMFIIPKIVLQTKNFYHILLDSKYNHRQPAKSLKIQLCCDKNISRPMLSKLFHYDQNYI